MTKPDHPAIVPEPAEQPDQEPDQAPVQEPVDGELAENEPTIEQLAATRPTPSGVRVRLAKLVVEGFKSFADKVEFDFDRPITGVVGPNGCGKSNVVDAVKWVLGEQSAKSLRGGAMLDVIFNGSADRKPAGGASVTLVFENPADPGGLRHLGMDADEVAVTRMLFRDGTSKYKLNGKNARLKDVRDLFLDTGIGVGAYSVIEQGRVAQMLEANPAQRRLIFEEAAGISRFKQRKKEALRKLDKTEQNLTHLVTVIDEVEKRLRSVKLQAGKARNYQELVARLDELKLAHALNEYRSHVLKLEKLAAQQADAESRHGGLTADLQGAQNALAESRQAADEADADRQRAEQELTRTDARRERAEQAQRHAAQQLAEVDRQAATQDADRQAAADKRRAVAEAAEATKATLAGLTDALTARQAEIDQRDAAHRDAQLERNELAQSIDAEAAAVLELERAVARADNRLSSIDVERRNLEHRQGRAAERRRAVVEEAEGVTAKLDELQQQLDACAAEHETQQADADRTHADAQKLGGRIAELSDALTEAREARSGLVSRRALLDDLESHQEGVSDAVRSVIDDPERYPFIEGLVADVLSVDVEHAPLVEAALFGRDQWLIAADADATLDRAGDLATLPGRVNVLRQPAESQAATPAAWGEPVRLLADLVRVDARHGWVRDRLLGRTAAVGSLADARRLHEGGPAGWRYVTAAGEVLEADGTLRAGKPGAAMGIISRRSELAELARQIGDADARIDALNDELHAGNEQARAMEASLNELRRSIYQTNERKVKLSSERGRVADTLARLDRERPVLEKELAEVAEQADKLRREHETLTADRAKAAEEREAREAGLRERQAKVDEVAGRVATLAEELTAARVALGQAQQQQLAARERSEQQAAQVDELTAQLERLRTLAGELAGRREKGEADREAAEAEAAEAAEAASGLRASLKDAAERAATLAAATRENAGRVETLRERIADVEQQLRDVELKTNDRKIRLETLVARVAEDDEIDLPAKFAEAEEVEEMDWPAVAAEIKELRGRIARLGNVNLDSIADLEELEDRQKQLATQLDDVQDGKRQLVGLIDDINAESGVRFEQTFHAVREHFQGMFRKLFGGGRADVLLETEVEDKSPHLKDGEAPDGGPVMKRVDPLDAGIEIIARPPGKQPASISQLSGGEKTMTCIALLMAIFKSKPSPFCILDEVDAALDEANNVRFNRIVEDFLEMSQFIVITHSKRTMQIADVLYGVTMQQQGVSKKVAVKFDQVGDDGEVTTK